MSNVNYLKVTRSERFGMKKRYGEFSKGWGQTVPIL